MLNPPRIADVLGSDNLGSVTLPSNLNPEIHAESSGFFGSLLSAATREQIGMSPAPGVQQYRDENPIRGFTSQVLPEIALFSLPETKAGAIAVRSLRPAADLLKFGEKAVKEGRPFIGGAAKLAGNFLPILGARQVGSLLAPEKGSAERIAQRNAMDLVFGGAFAGTAEFLAARRFARLPYLRGSHQDPEGSLATIQRYFPDIDLNDPAQDQFRHLLQLAENPANVDHPVLQDIRRTAGIMRAEILTQEPLKGRPFVKRLPRPAAALANKLFRSGKILTEAEPEFAVDNILPKDFEAFVKYPRAVSVTENRAGIWRELNQNFHRVDTNTFLKQENDEGLFVLVKKVLSQEEPGQNRLFVGRPEVPDRYLIMRTNKPWMFVQGGRNAQVLEEAFVRDPKFTEVADTGFLDTAFRVPRASKIPGTDIPTRGNTPTLDAIDRQVELVNPWQKGLQGLSESVDQLETPALIEAALDKVSQTVSDYVPKTEGSFGSVAAVKQFSREAGHMIREAGQVSRRILAPSSTGSQFRVTSLRASVLNRIISQAFHRLPARVRQTLWGKLDDSVLEGNIAKNLFLRRHDVRTGGILTKAVLALDSPEKLAELSMVWRGGLSLEEAAQRGVSQEVMGFLRELDAHDAAQILELQAQRAALGIEDDFVPLKNHYALSRMWEGNFRVELYDDLNNQLVGYAGGHNPRGAMENAQRIVARVNAELPEGAPKLRTPTPDHLSTTEYLRLSKELSTEAGRLAKEVDAFQRGAKINPDNFLTDRVIRETQRMHLEDPIRFQQRTGAIGFTGQFEPLKLDEVLNTIAANTIETQRLLTKEALVTRLQPQLAKLAAENPDALRQLTIRFNSHLGYQGPVAKKLDGLVDAVLAPYFGPHAASRAVRKMNRGMFGLTLAAGDVGFLTLNTLTGVQTIAPEAALLMGAAPRRLAGWYGLGMLETGKGIRPFSYLDPARVTWQAFNELRKLTTESDPALVQAVLRAHEEAIISRPVISEIREFSELAANRMHSSGPVDAVLRFNEDLIGRSEEFSRAWAFVTGRKVAKEFLKQSDEQAYETAKTFVSRTMYEYTAGDRARVATGAIGSGWGLFKTWTFNYASNLMAYADEAFYKNNWTPLLWTMIGTGSVGGAVAMPGYGMASRFSEMLSNKDLTEWTYEAADVGGQAGHMMADGFNYGLPAVLGVTLTGRAAVPGASVVRDASLMFNVAMADRAAGLGRAFGAIADQWADGNMIALNDRRVQRGLMQAFAPRTLQRAYTYWGADGLQSLKTGNKLVSGISKFDAALHVLGMTPLEVERAFEVADNLYQNTDKLRTSIRFFGESYAQAWQNQDYEGLRRIYRRAMAEGVPFGSIKRSAVARIQNDQDDLLERQFDDILVRRAKQLRGVQ